MTSAVMCSIIRTKAGPASTPQTSEIRPSSLSIMESGLLLAGGGSAYPSCGCQSLGGRGGACQCVGTQIGVFGMPPDVRVNACTLGDQLAAIAPDVIEGGPGELRAVALAFVFRGHLGVSEGADAVAIRVVQHAAALSGVAQFVAAL